jgi:hypothetical protein
MKSKSAPAKPDATKASKPAKPAARDLKVKKDEGVKGGRLIRR